MRHVNAFIFFFACFRVLRITALTIVASASSVLAVKALGGDNLWLFAYVCEWLAAAAAAAASPFIGFVGFFAVTALAGSATALALLAAAPEFLFASGSLALNGAPLAKLGSSGSGLALYVDSIGFSFGLLTSLIGAGVYLYAFSYMRFEKNILNFLVYFVVFKLSMMLLVWSNSWATLILGWELIGASSFLLINYWTAKATTLKSAFKALSFNKLSDAALISAACISLWLGASTIQGASQFGGVLATKAMAIGHVVVSANDAFLACLCVAAFCKSAQLGFHFWLPDSMEAPVPASALIHSATLVSAGIYLLMRFSFCFEQSPFITALFQLLTAATAFYGALIASFQTDVKKILAYSTISHCGLLMYSITLFRPEVTVFYLFAHGFFKSLNFLCVGNFIQYANNYQDVSRMGGFGVNYRLEFFFLLVTAFNLSSAPLFLAFFSKHWLLNASVYNSALATLSSGLVFCTAFCGFFYSSKLFYETVSSTKRAHRSVYSPRAVGELSLVRRANLLGLAGMCLLFAFSCLVLVALFNQLSLTGLWRPDQYASEVSQATTQYQAWLLLVFSQVLFVLGLSYTTFKRSQARLAPLAALFVLTALICVM